MSTNLDEAQTSITPDRHGIVHGLDPAVDLQTVWRGSLAPVLEGLIDWFRQEDSEHKFMQVTRPLSF